MHEQARKFVAQHVGGRKWGRAVEIGSLDINGTVRDLVDAGVYVGIDRQPGPCVDIVADALTIAESADLVICCEVLEHYERWRELVFHAWGWVRPGGRLVVTCATDPRAQHAASVNAEVDEWYGNVSPVDFMFVCRQLLPARWSVTTDRAIGDLYAVLDREG